MSNTNWFKVIQTRDADEFLGKIAPRTGIASTLRIRNALYYRGQSDADWGLKPSLYRKVPVKDNLTVSQLVAMEWKILQKFFQLADFQGLPLPEDSQSLRETFEKKEPPGPWLASWPPNEVLSLMGLIQHHGLETRLLDFSRNPYTAAYFAAITAAEVLKVKDPSKIAPTHIAVWAYDHVGRFPELYDMFGLTDAGPLRLVTAPAAGNKNLHAQEGVFFVRKAPQRPDHIADLRNLEETAGAEFKSTTDVRLYKIVVPSACAGQILKQLALEGVDGASLFPGFDGVVKAVLEHALWL